MGTNARNEKNHLIYIDGCSDKIGGGIPFQMGDVFTTRSYYYAGQDDDRFTVDSGAAGEHKNLMSMFFLGVRFDGSMYIMENSNRTSFMPWGEFTDFMNL